MRTEHLDAIDGIAPVREFPLIDLESRCIRGQARICLPASGPRATAPGRPGRPARSVCSADIIDTEIGVPVPDSVANAAIIAAGADTGRADGMTNVSREAHCRRRAGRR